MKAKTFYQKMTNLPMNLMSKDRLYIQSKEYVREDKLCPTPVNKEEKQSLNKKNNHTEGTPWFDF